VFLGSSIFPFDSFLVAGILEWGYHCLVSANSSLFDWTAGFPLTNTLAVTENLIGWQIMYTPLRLLGVGIPAAYNSLVLASLFISSIGAALLAQRLGAGRAGAAAAGLVFGFGPFHLNHLLHLQTMAICWAPFAILFLDRYLETRSPRDAIGLAASVVIAGLSAMYLVVFLGLMLPLYAALCWILGRYRFERRAFVGLVATGAVAAAVLVPIISHYLRFNAEVGFHASAKTLANFSIEVVAPLHSPAWMTSWSWSPLVRASNWRSQLTNTSAFPGLVALALAVYGVVAGRRNRQLRTVIGVLLSLLIVSYLLALGPLLKPLNLDVVHLPNWVPLPGKLWLIVPGVRWPMRVFFFAWLAASILCGLGLSALQWRVSESRRRVLALGVILIMAIEMRPSNLLAGGSREAPAPMSLSDAYPYLVRETDRGGVIELPTADDSGWRTPFMTRYIYASSAHLRRVVAIHGSVTPPVTDTLLSAANSLPESMDILSAHGVTRVVIHRSLMPADSAARTIDRVQGAGYPILFAGYEGVVFGTTQSVIGPR
jgi:hypothetical protein